MAENLLQASGLYHVYESQAEEGNVVALRGLSIGLQDGEAVAVFGPSGAGKSTLLKALGGLMKPSAGVVRLAGEDVTRMAPEQLVRHRRATVSFIFQEGNLLPHLSARDNVMQPLRHAGVPHREALLRVEEMLEYLGLASRARALPEQLSGGEAQRTAIARALITRPRLILADEPTGSVDPVTARSIMALFSRLHKEQDVAFLIVTHSEMVSDFADRSLELQDGRFIAQHGGDVELEDLAQTREILLGGDGQLTLTPDLLAELGGAGRYEVRELRRHRLTLSRVSEERDTHCAACNTRFDDDEVQCAKCGALRG